MRNKLPLYMTLITLGLLLCTPFFNSSVLAQSSDREKPKLKNFGSSLKRIKWDEQKNAAIEIKGKDGKGNSERSGSDADVLRVEIRLVVNDVLVLDRQGRSVQGLTRDDFLVTEDGKPQQIGTFSLGNNVAIPRSIVLIVDHSCQAEFIEASLDAAKTLVDKLGPQDSMAVVTDDIELLVNFTRNKKKLKDDLELLKIKSLKFHFGSNAPNADAYAGVQAGVGRGQQLSALMATLKEAFDDEDLRPIIIFQTAGGELSVLRNSIITAAVAPGLPGDLRAREQRALEIFQDYKRHHTRAFSLDDVYLAAAKSRATIYTVIPGFRLVGLPADKQIEQIKAGDEKLLSTIPSLQWRMTIADDLKRLPVESLRYYAERGAKMQEALAGLSTITGGWTDFLNEQSQASDIYSRILSDINQRYIIGYYPINKERDGKRREIKIE
ncbi:MAG TPA: VWA domain-containing protein, partial [Pyrinomonadaceae bacterium]|nr:VWA domain-containing protein [Pyrinomonadaceae bacterium]